MYDKRLEMNIDEDFSNMMDKGQHGPSPKKSKIRKYPVDATNDRYKHKICCNQKELWDHLVEDCNSSISPISKILSARIKDLEFGWDYMITPDVIMDTQLSRIFQHYSECKQFGYQFFYPNGVYDIDNQIMEMFIIIEQKQNQIEQQKLRNLNEKMKKNK